MTNLYDLNWATIKRSVYLYVQQMHKRSHVGIIGQ